MALDVILCKILDNIFFSKTDTETGIKVKYCLVVSDELHTATEK